MVIKTPTQWVVIGTSMLNIQHHRCEMTATPSELRHQSSSDTKVDVLHVTVLNRVGTCPCRLQLQTCLSADPGAAKFETNSTVPNNFDIFWQLIPPAICHLSWRKTFTFFILFHAVFRRLFHPFPSICRSILTSTNHLVVGFKNDFTTRPAAVNSNFNGQPRPRTSTCLKQPKLRPFPNKF